MADTVQREYWHRRIMSDMGVAHLGSKNLPGAQSSSLARTMPPRQFRKRPASKASSARPMAKSRPTGEEADDTESSTTRRLLASSSEDEFVPSTSMGSKPAGPPPAVPVHDPSFPHVRPPRGSVGYGTVRANGVPPATRPTAPAGPPPPTAGGIPDHSARSGLCPGRNYDDGRRPCSCSSCVHRPATTGPGRLVYNNSGAIFHTGGSLCSGLCRCHPPFLLLQLGTIPRYRRYHRRLPQHRRLRHQWPRACRYGRRPQCQLDPGRGWSSQLPSNLLRRHPERSCRWYRTAQPFAAQFEACRSSRELFPGSSASTCKRMPHRHCPSEHSPEILQCSQTICCPGRPYGASDTDSGRTTVRLHVSFAPALYQDRTPPRPRL